MPGGADILIGFRMTIETEFRASGQPLAIIDVDLENFFQLRTVTLCLFAQTDALQTEIVIHLARVHVFFETTTGQASLLAALTAVLIGTSHILALQSPLPNPVPHLDVNEFGAA